MKNDGKIYLDQKGYDEYVKEINRIKDQLDNNGKSKSEAYENAVGDGWHDNFAFEEAKREEFKIMSALQEKIEGLSRIVIVDSLNEESVVDINDYVTIDMYFPGEEPEELIFKLVASNTPNFDGEVSEISLNSPLGKSVYGKKIGERTSYSVNENDVSVVIKNATKNYEQDQEEIKSYQRRK